MNKSPVDYHRHLTLLTIVLFLLLPGCASRAAIQNLHSSVDRSMADANRGLLRDTTDLMFQCARGDIVKVKELLNAGVDLHAVNAGGYTATMYAAEYGNLAITKLLIDHGVNIHKKNNFNHTALFLASTKTLPLRKQAYEGLFLALKSSYVGENDHVGVISYLILIGAPIFESSITRIDAEYTAKAFYNIATIYESHGHHKLAQQNYEVAMKHFFIASELNNKKSAFSQEIREAAERSASWAGVAQAMMPVLQAAGQRHQMRYQNKTMADALAIRDAKKHNLDTQQFLGRRKNYLESLEETPNLPPTLISPNTANLSKPTTGGNEGLKKINAAIASGFDPYQWKSKLYYGQAINVGLILECYKNEIADESFAGCLEWAKTEFTNDEKEANRQLLNTLGQSE